MAEAIMREAQVFNTLILDKISELKTVAETMAIK